MKPTIELVREFHVRMGQPIRATPGIVPDRVKLRLDLIAEEFKELCEACGYFAFVDIERADPEQLPARRQGIVLAADALADLDYVITGTALEFGIPHTEVVAEVHRSNMTKEPGNVRADGKILKGPTYEPPDIAGVLERRRNDTSPRHASDCDTWSGESCSREPGCPPIPPGVDAQPRPTTGDVEVWPLVLKDIEARMQFGMAKYGVPLRTNDGRNSLIDAYQESLDQTVYLRKAIEERRGG